MSTFLNPVRRLRNTWRAFWAVNWMKTFYFNFKMLPYSEAKKLPIFLYGKVKLTRLSGTIKINAPLRKSMVRIGYNYEKDTVQRGTVELHIVGSLLFKGFAQVGKDVFLYVGPNGNFEIGDMVGIASRSQVVVENEINIGDWTRISAECQVYDTDFHTLINTETEGKFPKIGSVTIGSHNFVGYRSTLKKGTVTPNFCTIAPMSLVNKSFSQSEENILLGGVPAKCIKSNVSRDWKNDKPRLAKTMGKSS